MVITFARAKCQGQRSLGSKVRVETDGRTDGSISSRVSAVGKSETFASQFRCKPRQPIALSDISVLQRVVPIVIAKARNYCTKIALRCVQ